MHSICLKAMFFNIKIVDVVANALLETSIYAAAFALAPQNKLLATYIAANGHFHSDCFHPYLQLTLKMYSSFQYGRLLYNLTSSSRFKKRNGDRELARCIFRRPTTHSTAMNGMMNQIQLERIVIIIQS